MVIQTMWRRRRKRTEPSLKESRLNADKKDAPSDASAKDDETKTNPEGKSQKWDPVLAVRQIMEDVCQDANGRTSSGGKQSNVPGSRFVRRMVPIQATCFASIEEITATFRALLDHLILPKEEDEKAIKSFGIKFKKQNCGNVTKDQVIHAIVGQLDVATKDKFGEEWKVDLDNPDYRIQVEICKTLCGMSILKASQEDAFMSSRNSIFAIYEPRQQPEEEMQKMQMMGNKT